MLRIGIIGSDNSHALAFSKLSNLPGPDGALRFPEVRVTALWGQEPERTAQVAAEGNVERIYDSPEEMLGAVDAVMVVLRHGDLHRRYALPFIEAGMPVWVDKPFAIRPGDAVEMVRAARKSGSLLSGGSTCKYCPDVLAVRDEYEALRRESRVISAGFNFPGELDSPWGGIWFYGGHAVEMLTTMFGSDVRSIRADVHQGNLIALFRYEEMTVVVNFAGVGEFYATLYSPLRVAVRKLDISEVYFHGFSRFVSELRGEAGPPSHADLLRPVALLDTLAAAIESGEETPCREIVL